MLVRERAASCLAAVAWLLSSVVAGAQAVAAVEPPALADGPALRPASPATFTHFENVTIDTGNQPTLRFHQDTSLGHPDRSWQIYGDEVGWVLNDQTTGRYPLVISADAPSYSLDVEPNGDVGLGTSVPVASLHVARVNGTARLRVQEGSAITASRNLLQLVNNGASTFRFDNSATGAFWGFGSHGTGDFFIGSSVGAVFGFDMTPAGNVTLAGTLTQMSDRDSKQDVEPADTQDVLARVVALPVSTWSYKADEGKVRHMGPMAQDFAAAFGLGPDDLHVAPSDVAGVSLSAVKALNDVVRDALGRKDLEIAALQAQNADLRARLGAIETVLKIERE